MTNELIRSGLEALAFQPRLSMKEPVGEVSVKISGQTRRSASLRGAERTASAKTDGNDDDDDDNDNDEDSDAVLYNEQENWCRLLRD